MPNQLSIPFKKTYDTPIKQAVRDYLHAHSDTHPDAFKWDIGRWETLRKDGVGGAVHVNRIDTALSYHAQLVFILTKLPVDIHLQISYAPAFSPSALPINLPDLTYERISVLFNLAALYCQLATNEDRSKHEGVKRAMAYFQSAAGTFSYLVSSALPKFTPPSNEEDIPLDLTESFVKSLEWLMLAQAQECVWQKAVMDNYKNGLVAKLAAQVSTLYRLSLTTIRDAFPAIRHAFPSNWLPHLETKQLHFDAAAQYRKGIEDLEANRYGSELARLNQALEGAKKGYNVARRGGVADAVFQDVKSLLDNVQKNYTRAERDNDLIYHQDVPAASALLPIQGVSMVQSVVPPGLSDPKIAIGNEGVIFGELLSWGAREAINIYTHNKQTFIREQAIEPAQELDDEVKSTLHSLNLPSSLEALEKHIGLSPSLLQKAEEVRVEDGPARIEASIEDVQKLAQHNMDLLNQAMDILDEEASDDEKVRKDKQINRPPSSEANRHLTDKWDRYRHILEEAAKSDELVRKKWDEWEKHIVRLTWDEEALESSVPATTGSALGSSNPQTRKHARTLRVLLESLDDLTRARAQLIDRVQLRAESDDIKPRILKAATGIERWVEVKPVMFDDVLEEEMAKYDKFTQEIEQGRQKQEQILEDIKATNEAFLQSRRDDPAIKDREHALQSLDLAYHKYKEISRNLEEGLKFYNDLAGILTQFKHACKIWTGTRKQEIFSLTHSLESLSLQGVEDELPSSPVKPLSLPQTPANSDPPPRKRGKAALDLPSLNSDEWEVLELPPGPSQPSPAKDIRRTPQRMA